MTIFRILLLRLLWVSYLRLQLLRIIVVIVHRLLFAELCACRPRSIYVDATADNASFSPDFVQSQMPAHSAMSACESAPAYEHYKSWITSAHSSPSSDSSLEALALAQGLISRCTHPPGSACRTITGLEGWRSMRLGFAWLPCPPHARCGHLQAAVYAVQCLIRADLPLRAVWHLLTCRQAKHVASSSAPLTWHFMCMPRHAKHAQAGCSGTPPSLS